jgi:hypothetical protein
VRAIATTQAVAVIATVNAAGVPERREEFHRLYVVQILVSGSLPECEVQKASASLTRQSTRARKREGEKERERERERKRGREGGSETEGGSERRREGGRASGRTTSASNTALKLRFFSSSSGAGSKYEELRVQQK